MNRLTQKRILIGITGGIAAYKTADLIRRLRAEGAHVRAVMTEGAKAFVTPLTIQAVSGNRVHDSLLDAEAEAGMGHISLARWADLVVIAPASANCLSKLACGGAGDLLETVCLATEVPIMLAPAMNRVMWENTVTQQNLARLTEHAYHIIGPAHGSQACGEVGPGRMVEPAEILEEIVLQFQTGSLSGKRVLITAGPTREPIDPVRYISNRSSGKMGYALAQACLESGASVTLVSGPVNQASPDGAHCIPVETACEMYDAVMARTRSHDIVIACAAVSDVRPDVCAKDKIKKANIPSELAMTENPDIIRSVSELANRPFTVGFAAESGQLKEHAKTKLHAKNLDLIFANNIAAGRGGFESDENAGIALWQGGEKTFEYRTKSRLARDLVALIGELYDGISRCAARDKQDRECAIEDSE